MARSGAMWAGLLVAFLLPAWVMGQTPATEVAVEVDRHIDALLAERRVPASPPANDAEFLRRAWLDIAGRIRTFEQAVEFLDN